MDYKLQNISGYIEGYYGKLLTWENRFKIVEELKRMETKSEKRCFGLRQRQISFRGCFTL